MSECGTKYFELVVEDVAVDVAEKQPCNSDESISYHFTWKYELDTQEKNVCL